MKKLLIPLVVLLVIAGMSACNDEETDSQNVQQLYDSIGVYYPTAQAIRINPLDRENLIVVLGDLSLYNAQPEVRQSAATKIGSIAMGLWGKHSYLKKGSLVITRDVRNEKNDPADGITTPINIDSLRKVMFP